VADAVSVPVIASGGAGRAQDVVDVLTTSCADAALVAGILHDGTTSLPAIKQALSNAGVATRPSES